jgi:hypothetical protein
MFINPRKTVAGLTAPDVCTAAETRMAGRRRARGDRPKSEPPPGPTPAPAPSRSRVFWVPLVVAVAGVAVYLNSLSNPFVLDDAITITSNEQIRDLTSLEVLTPERELPVAGRPIASLTFALNYAFGGEDVRGFRVVNLVIHIGCALLIFGIVRRALLLSCTPERLARRGGSIAFAVSILWVLHPLNSETINYLTQRTESLMALFYLLTLYASLRAATP